MERPGNTASLLAQLQAAKRQAAQLEQQLLLANEESTSSTQPVLTPLSTTATASALNIDFGIGRRYIMPPLKSHDKTGATTRYLIKDILVALDVQKCDWSTMRASARTNWTDSRMSTSLAAQGHKPLWRHVSGLQRRKLVAQLEETFPVLKKCINSWAAIYLYQTFLHNKTFSAGNTSAVTTAGRALSQPLPTALPLAVSCIPPPPPASPRLAQAVDPGMALPPMTPDLPVSSNSRPVTTTDTRQACIPASITPNPPQLPAAQSQGSVAEPLALQTPLEVEGEAPQAYQSHQPEIGSDCSAPLLALPPTSSTRNRPLRPSQRAIQSASQMRRSRRKGV